MSNRLAVSAAMSVLIMAVYVLFGADASRVPLSADYLTAPVGLSAPQVSIGLDSSLR